MDNKDRKLINLLLFVDLKKAFDMNYRKLLIKKLIEYDYSNNAINLIENYFLDRKQLVKIGPLLFFIYINDLPLFLSYFFVRLFADDTTMSFVACIIQCKKGIEALIDW